MGVVYKALDPLLERIVALKTISAQLDSEPDLRTKFFREGRSAAHLSHKNIITIYDLGEDNGMAYLAMEFLDGEDLKAKVRRKEIGSLDKRLLIMFEVCTGLSHAHGRQVIHRDIKPANVFITSSGQVKILDFGLARVMSADTTRTGATPGSPSYMSPEQVRGEKLDHRTDIFSAGALLYELLTFRRPFEGESIGSTIFSILHHEPEPPSKVDPALPHQLDAIVAKALAKNPEERYQSVQEMMSALRDCSPQLRSLALPEPGGDDAETISLTGIDTASSTVSLPGGTPDLLGSIRIEPPAARVESIPASATAHRRRNRLAYLVAACLVLSLTAASVWRIGRKTQASVTRTDSAAAQTSLPAGSSPGRDAAGRARAPLVPAGVTRPAAPAQGLQQAGGARTPDASHVEPNFPGTPSGRQGSPAPPRGEAERANIVARGIQQTKLLIDQGRYKEASDGLREVLRTAPADPEALRLAAQLGGYAKKNADDARGQMMESKHKAEAAAAGQFAAKSFEGAQNREASARASYDAGQFADAAAGFFESSSLYLSAALEAGTEKAASESRVKLSEQERQRTLQRQQADVSRSLYEQERLDAVKADVETMAPLLYQDAVQTAVGARAKWDREDYEGSKADFEKAADAMRRAKGAARDAAKKLEPPAVAVNPKPASPAAPAPAQADNSQQAISAVLQQYAASLQSKDLHALRSIWPSLGGQQERALQEEFKNAREIQVRFSGIEIKVAGDDAVATARRTYTLLTVDGQKLQTETRTVVDLRRNGKVWLIDNIRFGPI